MKDGATDLSTVLKYLGMNEEHSGLRWTNEKEKYSDNPDIYLALEQATFYGAIAVYFRLFTKDDVNPPQPQLYIYAFDNTADVEANSLDIHHRLWNGGVIPFCFVYGPSKIYIHNCSKVPRIDANGQKFVTKPDEIIHLTGNFKTKLERYAAYKFDSGLFWESEPGKSYKYSQTAYSLLIKQLKTARQKVIARVGDEYATIGKKIMVILILMKFLERRSDENGNTSLHPPDFYAKFNPDDPSLSGMLNSPEKFLAVLDKLSGDKPFNGQIFKLTPQEKEQVKKLDFEAFKDFAKGNPEIFGVEENTKFSQVSIWRLYSFEYLSLELVSPIYEDFLTEKDENARPEIIYTPPFMVQFFVDRCMPLSNPAEDFKVLDPVCGSGIFLMAALKRMIEWWRIRHNWKKPGIEDIEALKSLLINNIFGCDINKEAIRLTYFSVSLVILDALSPRAKWENVYFDKLIDKNLFDLDFFRNINDKNLPEDFDLVFGNPPFNANFTEAGKKIESDARALNPERPEVPNQKICLLFLEQSINLLKKKGNCFLLLSEPFLYNNAYNFRRYLFQKKRLREIYDFTLLVSGIFKSSSSTAKPAALPVLVENNEPDNKPVEHFIFRNTKAFGKNIEFKVDYYDVHKVSYKTVLESPKVWQTNFLGGGRLHRLVERVDNLPSLEDYLDEMRKNRGWKTGEGWIKATDSELKKQNQSGNLSKEEEKKLDKQRADWITGHPFVKTSDFTEEGIGKPEICSIRFFYRNRLKNKEIFEPPHLLIKKSVKGKKIPVELSNEYLTFDNHIYGIHAPKADYSKLENLKNYLSSDDNVPLMWVLDDQVMTLKNALTKADIMSLPDPSKNFKIDNQEKILLDDIINYYLDYRRLGAKSKVLNKVNKDDLAVFGDVYCHFLNSVYDCFRPSKPLVGDDFVAFPFILGETPEMEIPDSIESMEETLKVLSNPETGHNIWMKRVLRVYHKNVIFLYKPNQKHYWLPSIAIRDVDETWNLFE